VTCTLAVACVRMNLRDRTIAYDCRYFLGDRPCTWHKQLGVVCECEHYAPLQGSLLIIKLGAMGDVLRTTCLLPVLAKAWPGMRLSWITRVESVPLLEHNPYLTEVVAYGTDALVHVLSQTFDRVINLDASRDSAALTSMARSHEKLGYTLHHGGYVVATNAAAEDWLRMGVFDDLKRANQRTYQEIMCAILGLPSAEARYVFELTEGEKQAGQRHLGELGLERDTTIVGIHTGGGGRWRFKQWHEASFIALIDELARERGHDTPMVLFGGPLEREMNRRIMEAVSVPLYDAGCDNGVRHVAALLNCCAVVVSGDSLPMHLALAMGRRVVVLFGPTSHTEIELFGLGEKIVPDLDCLACYKQECDFVPSCMDMVSVEMVKRAIVRQLSAATAMTS
jgi:ADP-heptose:LPS heptosyltransferase